MCEHACAYVFVFVWGWGWCVCVGGGEEQSMVISQAN
jgi:hypothetical protein